jgi:hypothetical protein
MRVDGSKARLFATKKAAQDAARSIGWPVSCVCSVETRFQQWWALRLGIALDPYTGLAYMSRDRFGELYKGRNGDKPPRFLVATCTFGDHVNHEH